MAEIEQLSEDETFGDRELAAAVASRCFYHLEEYDEALRLALAAGRYFDVSSTSCEYASTMASKCVEEYIRARTTSERDGDDDDAMANGAVDARLESIVERMFDVCYARGQFREAIGIALEAQRLDKVEHAIRISGDVPAMVLYCYDTCKRTIKSKAFRKKVIETIVSLAQTNERQKEYLYPQLLCECLMDLGDHEKLSEVLVALLSSNDENDAAAAKRSILAAYQIAFDIVQLDDPAFLRRLVASLPGGSKKKEAEDEPVLSPIDPAAGDDKDGADAAASAPPELLKKLHRILSGGATSDACLNFLASNHHVDDIWLSQLRTSVDSGRANSVTHNALVVGHAYLVAGTTYDAFLRSNLNWLGKASHWSKFTASACMGVVHRGNTNNAMKLLKPYLPKPEGGVSQSPFSEAGALMGLGLLHSCPGASADDIATALEAEKTALANAATQESEGAREALQSGAALGIGLLSIASNDSEIVSSLRDVLYQDNAVAGEAVGIAVGLIHLGAGPDHPDVMDDMLRYAHDTQHEKIIRGLSLGVALMMLGQEQAADSMCEMLGADTDPILRYGGVQTIAMAYAGTSDHGATRRLLHIAVSDVNDDVRRAAVISLGFVLLATPEKLPPLIALLAASFNPHVRYGVCLSLAICCAGRSRAASDAAIALIEPLVDDKVDYVRQGALLAMSLLYMQATHGENVMVRKADGSYAPAKNTCRDEKVEAFRKKVSDIALETKISSMTRMGALMASGLVDAGGCNMFVRLVDAGGNKIIPRAVVGMMLWTQHWFWYPMSTMISLAMRPGFILGVNEDFKVPSSFGVVCEAKEHAHAYPEKRKEKKAESKERVKTAVLSVTAKQLKKKKLAEQDASMDTSESGKAEVDGAEAKDAEVEDVPSSFRVPSGCRVTPAMAWCMRLEKKSRFRPLSRTRRVALEGIVLVHEHASEDTEEEEEEEKFSTLAVAPSEYEDEDDEPDAPKPFVWTPPEDAKAGEEHGSASGSKMEE